MAWTTHSAHRSGYLAFGLIGYLLLGLPSVAMAQVGWKHSDFTTALTKAGGQDLNSVPEAPDMTRPLHDQTFYYRCKTPNNRVTIALRDGKIARAKWDLGAENDTLEKAFAYIEEVHALGPNAGDPWPVFREDPTLEQFFPQVSSTIVAFREIEKFTGYVRVSKNTGKILGGIFRPTGRFAPEQHDSLWQVDVYAREDFGEYIEIRSEAHKSQGSRPYSRVTTVTFADRDAYWDFTLWDMRTQASQYEKTVRQKVSAKEYEELQRNRALKGAALSD